MKYKKSIFIIITIAFISSVISLNAGYSRKSKPVIKEEEYPKTIKLSGTKIKLLSEPPKDTPLVSNLLLEEEKWDSLREQKQSMGLGLAGKRMSCELS